MSRPFIAAAIQAAPIWMNKAATTQKACRLIREASGMGARVVAFPESFIPAFPYGVWHHGVRRNMRFYQQLHECAVTADGPEIPALQAAAREARCVVVMGLTELAGGSLYNSQFFLGSDGSLLGRRRKLKPTSAERLVWGEGDGSGLRVFDMGETGRLGGLICGEHNLSLARFTMQSQQEQLHVASYPDPIMEGKPFADRVDAAVRHYAAEGQCFVLNATGFLDDEARAQLYDTPELSEELDRYLPEALNGCSSIIGPDGRYLCEPVSGREAILTAEVDLSRIPFSKFWFDAPGHSGRSDVFRLFVNFGGGGGGGGVNGGGVNGGGGGLSGGGFGLGAVGAGGDGGVGGVWSSPSEPPPSPPPSPPPPSSSVSSVSSVSCVPVSASAGPRELGKRVTLTGGRSASDLNDSELRELLAAVWRHGVVCVPDQSLSASQMVELSRRIGEPVVLPPCFFRGMREPGLPQICRVGNLRPGADSASDAAANPDLVISGHAVGEYWHHDGNFFGAPQHAVINVLNAKCVPPVGGKTQFLDSTGALHAGALTDANGAASSLGGAETNADCRPVFTPAEREALDHTTLTVSHEWISDFAGAPMEDITPMGMPHVHDAIQRHPVTGETCLYLPLNPEGLYDTRSGDHWAKSAEVWGRLEAAGYVYDHAWREGDLLLWDNLQLLHRAGGGFGDHPRLLLRTQTKYAQP